MPHKSYAPVLRGVGRALAECLDEIVSLGLPKRLVKLVRALESRQGSRALSEEANPATSDGTRRREERGQPRFP
jgi:hypothetical protein